jgi:hypothetical protein
VEALKAFRHITNLKILVALRSDVLERVAQESRDLSFQREKFEAYFIPLTWNRGQLRELIDKRLEHLFRRQYSGGAIIFDDVFINRVGRVRPFDYIVERTLMRPRDVIAFVNLCLRYAEGHYQVIASMIQKAEGEYSRGRREAIESEWMSAFPTIKKALDFVASFRKPVIGFEELRESEKLIELAFAIGGEAKIAFDPLYPSAKAAAEGFDAEGTGFAKEMVCQLYRSGAIGVKLQHGQNYLFAHRDQPLLDRGQIGDDCRVQIHPILNGAFNLRQKEE